MYGGLLIPFQSFSKFYLLAQKKKLLKEKAEKDGEQVKKGGGISLFLSTKYYNSQDILALAGDRAVGNVLEQALIFLPLFWLHALFVDPSRSFHIAAIYTVSRAIYLPLFMLNSQGYMGAIGISTAPGYLVTIYLFYQVAVVAVA
jgi:MAPEG family